MRSNIRPMFGLEFEVSFSALNEQAERVSPVHLLSTFMRVAADRVASLPAHESSGIFLSNGGRLYLDCGKPEITTPEVTTPTDACRYARAGEAILLDIAQATAQQLHAVQEIILSRCNVSYGGSGNAWACHESYGHRMDAGAIAEHFIPHAVSRIIYTGAGGFDNCSHGLRFLISPRVTHLRCSVSDNTQRNRGIFNTKNECLNQRGYNRLHVICGENVSSIRSQWLKMATTAVVVAMAEAGLNPGQGLVPTSPVQAMRTFARDLKLQAKVATTSGESLTAWEIQWRLLDKAKRFAVDGPISDWLPLCLRLWEETLERLRQGGSAVARSLDWAIKLDLFQTYVRRQGFTWDCLARWNTLLEQLDPHPLSMLDSYDPTPFFNSGWARLSQDTAQWKRSARELGVDWSELDRVLALRQQLFELDARFGELGTRGIFNTLEAGGFLEHQVPGVDNIAQATTDPPATGRARLRGLTIQRLARDQLPGACEWNAVWDYAGHRMLDLSDPFADQESWIPLDHSSCLDDGILQHRAVRSFERAIVMYDRGDYEAAYQLLQSALESRILLPNGYVRECHRFLAWVQARRGYTDGGRWLHRLHRSSTGHSFSRISDYLFVYRFQGLIPTGSFHRWCTKGMRQLSAATPADAKDVLTIRCCSAFGQLCHGRAVEAWEAYQEGAQPRELLLLHPRFFARVLVEQAETLRRLGRCHEGMALLDEAQQLQTDGCFSGDLADLTLTARAKYACQQQRYGEAWSILQEVLRIQRDSAHVTGEARTLLLQARHYPYLRAELDRDAPAAWLDRVRQLQLQRPALHACRLTRLIVARWQDWIAGRWHEGCDGLFWGL